ncbi:MAG: hypothetical protein R6U96_09885 [Promethearchaeia archaeon]
MNITPKKIFEDYLSDALPLSEAIDRLIFFVQESISIKKRIKSINLLAEIGLNDERVYNVLENVLISDANELVRNSAINALFQLFPDESSYRPFKFALLNEDSLKIKQNVYKKLISILNNLTGQPNERDFLLEELSQMEVQDFRVKFLELKKTGQLSQMAKSKLKDILINYLSYLYLKKSFWRIKITVDDLSITELRFIFKGLEGFPRPIKNLSDLNILVLRYNQLRNIPEWISSLSKLETLNLNVNNIKNIPESIGSLKNLKKLEMWKNALIELPETIGNLSNLEILKLRINKIKDLPSSIGNLSSLLKLDCHDNNLKKLPSSIGRLENLNHLDLSWNYISQLPSSMGNLVKLEDLRLEKNELVTLPSNLGGLKSLEILNLRENQLKEIPSSVGEITNLRILNLSNNSLKMLPESLSRLINLEHLHLGRNDEIKIPQKIKKMQNEGLKIII